MQRFDLLGSVIEAEIVGSGPVAGPTVVLLHAFPLSHAMWRPQVAHLAGRARVIAPDLRGFGSSRGPAGATATMAEMAADVIQLCRALGVARCVLAGLSMGGYVALALAAQAPELLAGLVLSDTKAEADGAEAVAARHSRAARALGEGLTKLADETLPQLLGATTLAGRPEVVRETRALFLASRPEGFAAAQRGMAARADSRGLLGSLRVPTAVIVGAEDVITNVAAARTLADGIPGATLTVLEGAGHLANLEAPVAWNAALDALLARVA